MSHPDSGPRQGPLGDAMKRVVVINHVGTPAHARRRQASRAGRLRARRIESRPMLLLVDSKAATAGSWSPRTSPPIDTPSPSATASDVLSCGTFEPAASLGTEREEQNTNEDEALASPEADNAT